MAVVGPGGREVLPLARRYNYQGWVVALVCRAWSRGRTVMVTRTSWPRRQRIIMSRSIVKRTKLARLIRENSLCEIPVLASALAG